ncbi:basic amino acid ABC transporter substrate-binding protein [filamentous cyanobacterium CCT1]|nr:basic amino acid ABC transporter substrate-binding protein [filamentous cyanobacterium CCT1]
MGHVHQRRHFLTALASGLLFMLGCSAPHSPLASLRAQSYVGDPETLVVSTEPAFPPFVYQTAAGELVGFDVDLMNEMARRLGLKVDFAYIPFDGLMATLEAGTADASIDAITITARRDETIDFSRPYFSSGLAVAVRRDETDIAALSDLAGKKIAVKLGTTGAELAAQVPNTQLVTFDSAEKALLDLEKGNVDAVIKDKPTTLGMLTMANIQDVRLLDQLLTEEYYGIALPPNSPNKPHIDAVLNEMLADGTIAALHRKWFGYDPEPVPEVGY